MNRIISKLLSDFFVIGVTTVGYNTVDNQEIYSRTLEFAKSNE